MTRSINAAAMGVFAALVLVGCSASANLTVSPDTVAQQAADALQEQVGSDVAPDMDCGDESIELAEGTVVDCVLTDPTSGAEYDAQVTLSDIDGTDYHIDVSVADTPR